MDMALILFQCDPLMISSSFYTSENPNVIFILYIKILFSRVKIVLRNCYKFQPTQSLPKKLRSYLVDGS